ncbi:MAG: secretin N-terminal domain-containing protein [Cyanobacteria bacterium J06638_7]
MPQASLQVNRLNLAQPGAVPLPTYAPPLQPRAVAPPLGDMAVGTMMMRSAGFLNVAGPPVTMTLRNAPAKDALMALAQLGGYGFAYVEDFGNGAQPGLAGPIPGQPLPAAGVSLSRGDRPISIAFRNESYSTAINTTLLSAGLQGRREGNVIFAGPQALGVGIGPQMSKVYRLNQVSPADAARYLANLGATVIRTKIERESTTEGIANAAVVFGSTASQTTASTETVLVEEFGATRGPLLGLRATTDDRLGTITMVGSPDIVGVGEQYLKQLDLRQRQVALNVKILDVNLDNVSEIDNSFAFRFGNNFIVNNSGQLLGAFGRNLPPAEDSFQRRGPDSIDVQIDETGVQFDLENPPPNLRVFAESNVNGQRSTANLRTGSANPNPGLNYPDDSFFSFIRAQIVSGSTKLLASPTLILQENPSVLRDQSSSASPFVSGNQGLGEFNIDSPIGRARANEGVVRVGTNVVTNYDTESPEGGGNVVCTPILSTAGLVLGARVEKIDDNGFVTFTLSPSVSAVTGQEPPPPACGSPLNILSVRSLDTGALRVRDGQTLIMTGVISEFDREEVTKWPILGDIPLIGQFFRASGRSREKRELVIMVTPRIVDDGDGGLYGYGYRPGTNQVRDFFGSALQNGNGF